MVKENDKILVALSGGKDSLALVHILLHFKRVAPVKFEIGACTIDPKVKEYDPTPLVPYMKEIGVPYFLEQDDLIERAKECM